MPDLSDGTFPNYIWVDQGQLPLTSLVAVYVGTSKQNAIGFNASGQLALDFAGSLGGVVTQHNTLDNGSGGAVFGNGGVAASAFTQFNYNWGGVSNPIGGAPSSGLFIGENVSNGHAEVDLVSRGGGFSFYTANSSGVLSSIWFSINASGSVTTANNTLDNGSGAATFAGLVTLSTAGTVLTLSAYTSSTTTEVDFGLDSNAGGTGVNAQHYYWSRRANSSFGGINADFNLVIYDGSAFYSGIGFDYTNKRVGITAGNPGWTVLTYNNTLDNGSGAATFVGLVTFSGAITGTGTTGTLTAGTGILGTGNTFTAEQTISATGTALSLSGSGSTISMTPSGGMKLGTSAYCGWTFNAYFGTGTGEGAIYFENNNGSTGTTIWCALAGAAITLGSTAYYISVGHTSTTSDSRLKPDFTDYAGDPLAELKAVRFGQYKTLKDADGGKLHQYDFWKAGVAAETLPDSVRQLSTDTHGYGQYYSVVQPHYDHWIVGVLKAQQEEIEALQKQLAERTS